MRQKKFSFQIYSFYGLACIQVLGEVSSSRFLPHLRPAGVTNACDRRSVVAQRKLLYLERLFVALLLAAPKLKEQLHNKILQVQSVIEQGASDQVEQVKLKKLNNLLVGLQTLLCFYLPAVFRVGYLVRCCTWEGRAAGSGTTAKQVIEDVFVLLVHLLQEKCCKNEYVRTLGVAIITWQSFMSRMPAVCFVEESCKALLSRKSHRCEMYRHLHGLDATFNLFLTLPMPSRVPKGTRGSLKRGLVSLFAAGIGRLFSVMATCRMRLLLRHGRCIQPSNRCSPRIFASHHLAEDRS